MQLLLLIIMISFNVWSAFGHREVLRAGPLVSRQTVPRLVDFQVSAPLPEEAGVKQCTIQLLDHVFGNSFGIPAVVDYTPPTDCGTPGTWSFISLNWTATSNGTQFDRLSTITLHNVEIWRTSTPEPTLNGIIWTFMKDVSRYIPLFAKPGTLILDLGNIIDPSIGITASYEVTLSATFFASDESHPPAPTANVILPISNLSPNMSNVASVPPDFSLTQTFPKNTIKAFAEIYASGNSNEEFWYFNAPDEFLNALPAGFTFGGGPFREVRLLVDDLLAGVAYPYAVFFTGAIVPPAWRPITSYGALDLPNYYVDLTPFVPMLADGSPHNITLDVVSGEANHTINQNWFVSGNIQVVTDPSGKPTKGNMTLYQASPFGQSSASITTQPSGDVTILVNASRSLRIEADVIGGSGETTHVAWQQDLSYTNGQFYSDDFNIQNLIQSSTGLSTSKHNGVPVVSDALDFPVAINITGVPNGDISLFDHSYSRVLSPNPFTLATNIAERQIANGSLIQTNAGNTGVGSNNNTLAYSDANGNTFFRKVNASMNVIVFDQQSGTLAPNLTPQPMVNVLNNNDASWAARLLGGKQVVNHP